MVNRSIYGIMVGSSPSWHGSGISPVLRSDVGKENRVPYPVWCILGDGEPVLVDTAFREDVAGEWANGKDYRDPGELLAGLGLKKEDVRKVVVTHLHIDHFTGYRHFPNARFYIQKREIDFWRGDIMRFQAARRAANRTMMLDLVDMMSGGRVVVVDGDAEVAPGVKVMLAGGHTPGLQMVSVATAGGTAVLASDNAYLRYNIDKEEPVGYFWDLRECLLALERAKAEASSADMVIPGHDISTWGDRRVVRVA
ncbi:MAG: N-acyl homoserine lactonase family protein [Nitrososphaerota archaeon]|nr:N-acyl homoserine lactonase family protein [Nitrososphaerota archaeon]MDG6939226.1 N-acyl homoserine lactonase family protein [Nitrososphaerota archaeon]